jgi:hypothetical protein
MVLRLPSRERERGLIFCMITGLEKSKIPNLEINNMVSKNTGNEPKSQIHTGISFTLVTFLLEEHHWLPFLCLITVLRKTGPQKSRKETKESRNRIHKDTQLVLAWALRDFFYLFVCLFVCFLLYWGYIVTLSAAVCWAMWHSFLYTLIMQENYHLYFLSERTGSLWDHTVTEGTNRDDHQCLSDHQYCFQQDAMKPQLHTHLDTHMGVCTLTNGVCHI